MTNNPDIIVQSAPTQKSNPAKPFALLIIAALAGIAGWYALSDRHAPSTSRAFVSANVVQIAPRVSGRVTEIMVSDNEVVPAGDLLFQIDDKPFELAVEQARAQLDLATQSINASSAQLSAAYAQVAQARASLDNSKSESARIEELSERGLVPTVQLEASRTQLANAESALDAAEAQAKSAEMSLGVTGDENPQIRSAQLGLERAEYDLLSTKVVAPRRGVVTNLQLAPGQFVGAGQPALTFIEDEGVWITAELRENQLVEIDAGDRATLVFDADPGSIYEGRVQSLGWGINLGRSQAGGLPINAPNNQWFEPARRMPVRIEIDGGLDAWPRKARVGGNVSVLIHATGGGVIASIASGFQRAGSWLTALY